MTVPEESNIPDDVPSFPRMYWEAVQRWYATDVRREPQVVELVGYFRPRISVRSFYYQKKMPQNARWLGHWPPQRGDRPPWEPIEAVPLKPADRAPRVLKVLLQEDDGVIRPWPATIDEVGRLIVQRALPALAVARLAAQVDLCRLAAPHIPHLHHALRLALG